MMPPVDPTRTNMAYVCIQTKPHDIWRCVHRDEVRNALRNTKIGDPTAPLYGWCVTAEDCVALIKAMDTAPERRAS